MKGIDPTRGHTILVVARRTGLNPDVIRAWERRYKAVEPRRTGNRRRVYSDDDVIRLRLLRQATLAGRRIGDVAHLSLEDLQRLVRGDAAEDLPARPRQTETSPHAARYLERCLRAATKLDARDLEVQLNRAAMELEVGALFECVLSPMLRRIGEGWLTGSLSIAHEHMATASVRALLESMRGAFSDPSSALRMIATTPAGQHHEIGALQAAVLAAMEGWQATYLGTNLPAREIVGAALHLEAHVVALSVVYPEHDPNLDAELRALTDGLPRRTRLIVGGEAAHHYETVLTRSGASMPSDMSAFRAELRRLAGAIND